MGQAVKQSNRKTIEQRTHQPRRRLSGPARPGRRLRIPHALRLRPLFWSRAPRRRIYNLLLS